MLRHVFFTVPLLLLGASCADDREPARAVLGPSMSLNTVAPHGANSTICAAYNRQLALANEQLGISPGNAAIEHRITVLNGVIRNTCS